MSNRCWLIGNFGNHCKQKHVKCARKHDMPTKASTQSAAMELNRHSAASRTYSSAVAAGKTKPLAKHGESTRDANARPSAEQKSANAGQKPFDANATPEKVVFMVLDFGNK